MIFTRLPLVLALTCEGPKPGDYKAMEVVGQPVLIARDKAGTVRAFFNVCAHRWAPVATEGLGKCPALSLHLPLPRLDLRRCRQAESASPISPRFGDIEQVHARTQGTALRGTSWDDLRLLDSRRAARR